MRDIDHLLEIPTKDLIAELMKREGVEHGIVPPYSTLEHNAEGSAIVLTVID